jgi:signal transduction histidine kinase
MHLIYRGEEIPVPVLGPRRLRARLLIHLRHLSHRSQIALAFVALILSSASCTILIGNAIFGRKANELAQARLELDLKVVDQVLLTRLDYMRSLMLPVATLLDPAMTGFKGSERLCDQDHSGIPFDFLGVLDTASRSAFLLQQPSCTQSVLAGTSFDSLEQSDLGRFAKEASASAQSMSGFLLLPRDTSLLLGLSDPPDDGLSTAAVTPLEGGRVLFLGSLTNGQMDLVSSTLDLLAKRANVRYKASIFLKNVRIATTLGPEALGTVAAPEVTDAVLDHGGSFAGNTLVNGQTMDAAYKPLRDFDGRIVGMLGIGTEEDVYGEIRRRTASLFTIIIAAGMTFGFAMAWFFSVTLTRPLKDLAEGMDRVARGDLDLKVRLESADELGQLARAFNLMVRAVKERDMRLHEVNQERLSQLEKQVSVGRLAAGVAHEINNPLTAILSLSMLTRDSLPEKDGRRDDLDIVVTETTRCRDIVRSLLDFARERPPEKRVVDVNQVLRETLSLTARYDALAQVRMELRFSETPLRVNADAKQLQQVFTNVILNAAEASRPGGSITISTDEDSSGGFALVRVQDTGKGIPEQYLNRVFEPFFTTKGTGKGTGLGLSVSLGIIQRHNGAIDIESWEGRGTRLTITIPIAPQEKASEA